MWWTSGRSLWRHGHVTAAAGRCTACIGTRSVVCSLRGWSTVWRSSTRPVLWTLLRTLPGRVTTTPSTTHANNKQRLAAQCYDQFTPTTQLNSTVVTGWQCNDVISIVTSRCCAQTTRCLLAVELSSVVGVNWPLGGISLLQWIKRRISDSVLLPVTLVFSCFYIYFPHVLRLIGASALCGVGQGFADSLVKSRRVQSHLGKGGIGLCVYSARNSSNLRLRVLARGSTPKSPSLFHLTWSLIGWESTSLPAK